MRIIYKTKTPQRVLQSPIIAQPKNQKLKLPTIHKAPHFKIFLPLTCFFSQQPFTVTQNHVERLKKSNARSSVPYRFFKCTVARP